MKRIGILLLASSVGGCSVASDDLGALRQNLGKVACNATNGVFVGRIVDVTTYEAVGQSATPVYVVEREGRRFNAPAGNTVIVSARCSDGQPAAAAAPAAAPVSAPEVDADLKGVATEFSRRLVAYQGSLDQLHRKGKSIVVRWHSNRCDMVEGEVIDFLLSLNRGHPQRVTDSIEAERTCSNAIRVFRATASQVELYRSGRMSDSEILKGLQ